MLESRRVEVNASLLPGVNHAGGIGRFVLSVFKCCSNNHSPYMTSTGAKLYREVRYQREEQNDMRL